MFRWFRRKFGYSDSEKAIFRYWDGRQRRRADPFVIQRQLEEHGGKRWIDTLTGLAAGGGVPLDKLSPGLLDSVKANYHGSVQRIADMVRKAFAIPAFDEGGLTESGCVSVLGDYLDWVTSCREEFRPLLMPSMLGPQTSTDAPTESTAASCSTESESEPTGPKTSPEESAAPLQV